MILPYNVDRPARLTPTVTYALMAINVLVYVLGIGYTNYKMYTERPEVPDPETIMVQPGGGGEPGSGAGGAPGAAPGGQDRGPSSGASIRGLPGGTGQQAEHQRMAGLGYSVPISRGQATDGGPAAGPTLSVQEQLQRIKDDPRFKQKLQDIQMQRQEMESLAKTPEGRRQLWAQEREAWNLEHVGDALALDTHPDIMEWMAYLTVAPSFLAMLTSMFLHADLMHLMGNMLFLWVFGRAVEDTLGRAIYLGAYFMCGFGAVLLYHVMSGTGGLMVPFMGASGAIMGVLGLFAPRFYRTPVRLFYTNLMGARIFYLGTFILGGILARGLGLGTAGGTFAALIMLAGIVLLGDETLWGEWKVAAAWIIGLKIALQDLAPALIQMAMGVVGGGVAHWAHIGGFACGVGYAFLIGAHKEGKIEYLVDEARQSLDLKHAGNALESAQQVVMMKPDDPVGYQLLAEAHDRKDSREEALKNYQLALDKYLRRGERSAAAQLYQDAIVKHAEWVPDAPTLFVLASQMAKDDHWKGAAESLAKLPYYYPEASESEMAFLRSAQIYIEKLQEPMVAMQLLHEFGNRFPESQWMPKATKMYEAANQMHADAPAK